LPELRPCRQRGNDLGNGIGRSCHGSIN
jgi:hypothetical protein